MSNTEKLDTGTTPLTEENLAAVAGGMPEDAPDRQTGFYWMACAEGRKVPLGRHDAGIFYQDYRFPPCPKCGETAGSLYCYSMAVNPSGGAYWCTDTKCYNCNYNFGKCDMKAGQWEVYIENWGR